MIDALLQIAFKDSLRPHIPVEVWAWLKRPPSFPPSWPVRPFSVTPDVVRHVRGFGDIEILKSYLLFVWSEWIALYENQFSEMEITIREEFCGIAMRVHRKELIERLDQIRVQLDRGLDHFKQYWPWIIELDLKEMKRDYGRLKMVLLEIGRDSARVLSRTPQESILS